MTQKPQQWPFKFASREERAKEEALRNHYRNIGIPAVAAAKCVDTRNKASHGNHIPVMLNNYRETD
jgi:hypothetical protein